MHFTPSRRVHSGTNSASLGRHTAIMREDYSLIFPPPSIAKYSFIQLIELGHHGEKENAQTLIAIRAFYRWATGLHNISLLLCSLCWLLRHFTSQDIQIKHSLLGPLDLFSNYLHYSCVLRCNRIKAVSLCECAVRFHLMHSRTHGWWLLLPLTIDSIILWSLQNSAIVCLCESACRMSAVTLLCYSWLPFTRGHVVEHYHEASLIRGLLVCFCNSTVSEWRHENSWILISHTSGLLSDKLFTEMARGYRNALPKTCLPLLVCTLNS